MNKIIRILLIFFLVSVIWQCWFMWMRVYRTVDGRTASQWLAFANSASKTVTYTATGTTTQNGKSAKFELNQGKEGQYQMNVTGDNGKKCQMGCDGKKSWYNVGDKYNSVDMVANNDISGVNAQIIKTVNFAGRPGIEIIAHANCNVFTKKLVIDRENGVILSMVTTRGKEISRMDITNINFKDVKLGNNRNIPTVVRAVSGDEVRKLLGRDSLSLGWLPKGMKLRGEYLDWCNCCQRNMVVTSYTDGLSAVTLFQMTGTHHCAMASGCHMAPSKQALVETRMVGKTTIVAVSDIDKNDFAKMLDSLK